MLAGRWNFRTHLTFNHGHWGLVRAEKDKSLITKARSPLFTLVKEAWNVLWKVSKATQLGTKYPRHYCSITGALTPGLAVSWGFSLLSLGFVDPHRGASRPALILYLDSTEMSTSAGAWRLKYEGSIHVKNWTTSRVSPILRKERKEVQKFGLRVTGHNQRWNIQSSSIPGPGIYTKT